MALLECNTALSPELVPARQRQGEGGEPASVDALAERRLRADLPVGYVAEVHLRHLDPLSGRKDDTAAPGGLEANAGRTVARRVGKEWGREWKVGWSPAT